MNPPSVYMFYGDNPLAISETIADLQAKLGDSAEFNVKRFAGASLDIEQLSAASKALPFLSERRLIIVESAEKISDQNSEKVVELLDDLPDTTALVIVETVVPKSGRDEKKPSRLRQWATDHPEKAFIRAFINPKGAAFAAWLSDRADGQIDPDAAQLLSHYVDEDPVLGDQELQKLLRYVDGERAISVEDVERLSPAYGEIHIFDVVDKLGDAQGSLAKLQQILEEQEPRTVFPMVVRQFRLMLLARLAIEGGEDPISATKLHPYVARKISAQSQRFSVAQLKEIYQRLHELDISVKRGEADLSLDLLPLIASIT